MLCQLQSNCTQTTDHQKQPPSVIMTTWACSYLMLCTIMAALSLLLFSQSDSQIKGWKMRRVVEWQPRLDPRLVLLYYLNNNLSLTTQTINQMSLSCDYKSPQIEPTWASRVYVKMWIYFDRTNVILLGNRLGIQCNSWGRRCLRGPQTKDKQCNDWWVRMLELVPECYRNWLACLPELEVDGLVAASKLFDRQQCENPIQCRARRYNSRS